MPSLADAVGGRTACLTSAVRVPHQAAQSREPLLLDFYLLCLKADHIILRKKRAIKCGLDRGEIIKTYSSVRALKFFFLWLWSPQGNKYWTKYNRIQMAYPMELCLMEVTQQRAKVERRKRPKMPRGVALGLIFNTTFLKNCTCSICVSSYFMLTCASIRFSPPLTPPPRLSVYEQSWPFWALTV